MVGHRTALVIGGVTASGKSELALALAEHLDGVIINADSLQLYRDLPILTARPDDADARRAPHRLYGILDATDEGSVARWRLVALAEVEEARRSGKRPILVGGTGMYIAALTEGLARIPDIEPSVRWKVRHMSLDAISAELYEIDHAMAESLEPKDRQRRARALEVIWSTGRSLLSWQNEPAIPGERDAIVFAVLPNRADARERAKRRAGSMLANGAIDQVAELTDRIGDPTKHPIRKAIGVDEIVDHLNGKATLEEAVERISLRTGQYIKRQETWFKRRVRASHRIDAFGESAEAFAAIVQRLSDTAG